MSRSEFTDPPQRQPIAIIPASLAWEGLAEVGIHTKARIVNIPRAEYDEATRVDVTNALMFWHACAVKRRRHAIVLPGDRASELLVPDHVADSPEAPQIIVHH